MHAGLSLAVRPFPTDQCCVRLCRADLREHPTGPASDARSSRRRRPPQYAIVSSADPLITDIWRTGSGQSKRFGEPLAVADGDGIRRHPARTANTKAPAAAASARVLQGPRGERRGQAGLARGRQVGLVRRGQHDLPGLEPEQRGRAQVRLRVRLVRARHVRAEDQVPRQPGCLRHVKQQRRVPVRQRPHDVALLDRRDPRHAVRPRRQEAPGASEPVQFPGAKPPGLSPSSRSVSSRVSRCSTSRDANGLAPERTSCIAGWYRPRQESANAGESSSRPCPSANERTAAAIPDRQSTTVPNTSNSTARTVKPVEGARYVIPLAFTLSAAVGRIRPSGFCGNESST